MNYLDTIDIFWGRLMGGLGSKDYSSWALGLLMKGVENEDVIYLASNEDLHWQDIERCFEKVLEFLGEHCPKDVYELCDKIEGRLLEKYSRKEISGENLVAEGYQLWLKSERDVRYRCWNDLGEDISMCTTEYGSIFYDLDKNDIEGSILRILIQIGKVAPGGDSPRLEASLR